MLSAGEIARGVRGAFGLLQRDPAALQCFDNSWEACARSFRVMVLVAPLYAVYLLIYYDTVATTADNLDIALVEGLRYLVDWLLFPVLFHEIAARRGWLARYPRYIGALNWINLPAIAVAIAALAITTIAPPAVAAALDLGLRGLFFYWFLTTTRMLLGVNWGFSLLLLVVNWVPSLLLSLLVARYVGVVTVT